MKNVGKVNSMTHSFSEQSGYTMTV